MDTNQKQLFLGYVQANSNCFKTIFQRLEVQICFFAYYYYHYYYYCIPRCGQKGPMNQLSVLLSFCPSFLPSGSFLGIGSLIFSETQPGIRGTCAVHGRARFFEKIIFATKMRFLKFIGKFSYKFFVNLVYNESSYYFLYSCTNSYLGKIWFLRYGPKCSRPVRLC